MGQSNTFLDGKAFLIISGTDAVAPPTKGLFFRCVVPIGGGTYWKGKESAQIKSDFGSHDMAVGGVYATDAVGQQTLGADWGTYEEITRISGQPLKAYFW